MSEFAPIHGLVGGSLMGLAASTLLLGNGDILGCSNIVSPVILKPLEALSSSNKWRFVFLSSFLMTSTIIIAMFPSSLASVSSDILKTVPGYTISNIGYSVSGLLVGFGTRLGSGCTSGHGICGLARTSKRSFVAVLCFMATGIVTATFVIPMDSFLLLTSKSEITSDNVYQTTELSRWLSNLITVTTCLVSIVILFRKPWEKTDDGQEKDKALEWKTQIDDHDKLLVAAFAASVFSAALAISGMVQQEKILGFLDLKSFLTGEWDGTLVMVMAGGCLFSAAGYHWVEGFNFFTNDKTVQCPFLGDKESRKFNIPPNTADIDSNLLIGSSCFGIGWGLGGLCPAPALFVAASGHPGVLYFWWPFNILGVFIAEYFKTYDQKTNGYGPLASGTTVKNYGGCGEGGIPTLNA